MLKREQAQLGRNAYRIIILIILFVSTFKEKTTRNKKSREYMVEGKKSIYIKLIFNLLTIFSNLNSSFL